MREISEIEKNIEVENERLNLGIAKLNLFMSEIRRFYSEYISTGDGGAKTWLSKAYNTIMGLDPLSTGVPVSIGGLPTYLTSKKDNKGIIEKDTSILSDYEPRYRPVMLSDGKYDVEPITYIDNSSGIYNCIADFFESYDGNNIDISHWENKQREKIRILVEELTPIIKDEQVSVKETTEKIIEEQATHTIYSIQESKRARRISEVVLIPLFVLLIITTYITFIK